MQRHCAGVAFTHDTGQLSAAMVGVGASGGWIRELQCGNEKHNN